MTYTEELAERLRSAIAKYGSQSEVGRRAGVEQSLISRLLLGKTKTLEYRNAQALIAFLDAEAGTRSNRDPVDATAPYRVLKPEDLKTVPLLGIAQAAGYEPALEPLVDYLHGESDETHAWSEAKPGYFALTVDGNSMLPEYPPGTVLLVAGGEFPQRGDVVVAKLATGPDAGQVIVKNYQRKDNIITLSSLNEVEGVQHEWNIKEHPHYIAWMFPVVKAEIDLRRKRWEESR